MSVAQLVHSEVRESTFVTEQLFMLCFKNVIIKLSARVSILK